MRFGLRSRYALTIVAMVAAIVSLLAAALLLQFRRCVYELMQASADTMSREQLSQMEKRGEAIARSLAENVANPLYLSDTSAMYELLTTALQDEEIVDACVYDRAGRIVHDGTEQLLRYGTPVSEDAALPSLGPRGVATKRTSGDLLTVSMPVWVGDEPLGAVRVCLSLGRANSEIAAMYTRLERITNAGLRRNVVALGFTTVALIALGVALSVMVARTLARPITRLGQWAQAVGRGDYPTDLSSQRGDEVGELIRAFGQMSSDLRQTTVSRDHMEGILASMTDALALVKADGTIEMANAALGALLGYDQNELAGRPFASLVGESTRTEVANGLSRLGETGETLTLDTTYLRKDGTEVAVAFSASLMGTGTGAGQRIVSVAQDITERKRAEADLRFRADFEQIICTASKSFVNLPSSDIASEIDRILAAVGEFLNAGRGYVFTFSDDGRSMSSTHEWSASGIEPRFGGLQQLSTTDFPWWMERLNRLEDIRVDRVADLPEGERRTRETLEAQDVRSLVLLPMALGGHLFGLIGFDAVGEERQWSEDAVALLAVVRDIIMNALERERTEAERRALEAQVQHAQKLEGLGVLAGGIAHDFNNILAAILGNAELAMLALPEGAAASSSVGEIRAAAVRAAELVSQMLAYSGKTPFSLEAVDLNRLVTEMGRLLRVTLSKNAELRYYTGDDLPAIRADAARVRQVAMNLITNASEALGDEPGVVSVSTGVVQATREYLAGAYLAGNLPEGEYVFLQVTDTGCGFEAEVEAKLFDPFFSTKFTGRGLGLAAVFGIVRGHQGAIFVRGRSGRGATFRVLFPSAGARPASPPPPEHVPAVDEWRGSGTVLFADDEPALRRTVPHILRKLGFEVLLAEDGGEAVRLFGEHRDQLAVVILDLTMPVMNGIEAFQRIRRLDHYAKVILASGYPQDQVPGGFSQTGLAGFLQKPYDVRRLQACLRDVLATEAASHTEDC